MRFRSRSQPSTLTTRSAQSRLVRLVIGLAMVAVAIKLAADPSTWVWLFPGEMDRTTATPTLEDVSYNVRLVDETGLKPDEFRSELPVPLLGGAGVSDDSADDGERSNRPAVDPAELANVQDDTLGYRGNEYEQSIAILGRLRDGAVMPPGDPAATFPIVMVEPEHFRGRAVEIEGLARRILEIPAGQNDAGFDVLYELWVFTPDSGNNPWRIVAAELPASLPRGESLDPAVPVRLTGVFFKRQGYETQRHALHVAPLLLAKTVERVSRPTQQIVEFKLAPWVFGILGVVVAGLGLLFWRFYREDRAFERTTLNRFTSADQKDSLAKIPEVDTPPPEEFFRQLEAEEKSSEPEPPEDMEPSRNN